MKFITFSEYAYDGSPEERERERERERAARIRLIFRDEDLKSGSKPKPSKYSDTHAHTALHTLHCISHNIKLIFKTPKLSLLL
jgi:hypothetical protein